MQKSGADEKPGGDLIGTREAAALLGVKPSRLSKAVWDNRLAEPARAPGGAFVWSEHDLRRAARALLGRNLDDVRRDRGRLAVGKIGNRP